METVVGHSSVVYIGLTTKKTQFLSQHVLIEESESWCTFSGSNFLRSFTIICLLSPCQCQLSARLDLPLALALACDIQATQPTLMCFATNQNQICKITPVEVIVTTDVVAFVVVVELVVVVDFDVDVEYIVNSPRYSLLIPGRPSNVQHRTGALLHFP